jgi:hypothetical protein
LGITLTGIFLINGKIGRRNIDGAHVPCSVPLDYEKFDLENLSLQDAISGITDFESSDLIFQYPGTGTAFMKSLKDTVLFLVAVILFYFHSSLEILATIGIKQRDMPRSLFL